MSWGEIMELREELKDIRKTIGGHAVKLGKDFTPRSVDDDLNDLKKEIQELRNELMNLAKDLKKSKEVSSAVSVETEAVVTSMTNELRDSVDTLEKVVKDKSKKN